MPSLRTGIPVRAPVRRLRRRLVRPARARVQTARLVADRRRAEEYLEAVGVAPLLRDDPPSAALPPEALDLAFLHRWAHARKPKQVLELGVGHSTLALAHALWTSPRGRADPLPWLYVVDASEEWIDHTRRRIPPELASMIEFRYSPARARLTDGELCHYFEDLPDIRPRLIYLDGPDPGAVQGAVHGLSFTTEDGQSRPPISADLLLYESTLRRGDTVVIDGRSPNAAFLRRRLSRRWRFESDLVQDRHVFTLLD